MRGLFAHIEQNAQPWVRDYFNYWFECSPMRGAHSKGSSFGPLGLFFYHSFIFLIKFIYSAYLIFLSHPHFFGKTLYVPPVFYLLFFILSSFFSYLHFPPKLCFLAYNHFSTKLHFSSLQLFFYHGTNIFSRHSARVNTLSP